MQLFKAIYAFYYNLFNGDCEHPHVTAPPGSSAKACYCPDCGYRVVLLWTFCRCRTCGSKRRPRQNPDGRIVPHFRYCQYCGQHDHQIVKKDSINVHEMPYAILSKEIDYTEGRQPHPQPKQPNPFEVRGNRIDVVDGEVVKRREYVSGVEMKP